MTERKPARISWESWVDRQIREGRERGDFERLAGHGRPIADLDRPRDELWWVRRKLEREQISVTPPGLRLRIEAEATMRNLGDFETEADLREHLADLNDRIRTSNRVAHSGPPTTLMAFDVEAVVARWSTTGSDRGRAPS